MLEMLADPQIWISFATLTVLEIVLGIDNIVFISLVSDKLPPEDRARARTIGLALALVMRLVLLASISWIASLTTPILGAGAESWAPAALAHVSWRDLILFSGGLFLIYKATVEIHEEVDVEDRPSGAKLASTTFTAAIVQIVILDLVFSIDSVITAVGIADELAVMVAAVVVAVVVMMIAAGPISAFISKNPSTKMLALAFLVMVGMALIADGAGYHVERGYIYGAMAFSAFVEFLNLAAKRARQKERAAAAHAQAGAAAPAAAPTE